MVLQRIMSHLLHKTTILCRLSSTNIKSLLFTECLILILEFQNGELSEEDNKLNSVLIGMFKLVYN